MTSTRPRAACCVGNPPAVKAKTAASMYGATIHRFEEANFYKDTFISTVSAVSSTKNIAIGFARQYTDRTTYSDLNGWQKAKTSSKQPQVFTFKIDSNIT